MITVPITRDSEVSPVNEPDLLFIQVKQDIVFVAWRSSGGEIRRGCSGLLVCYCIAIQWRYKTQNRGPSLDDWYWGNLINLFMTPEGVLRASDYKLTPCMSCISSASASGWNRRIERMRKYEGRASSVCASITTQSTLLYCPGSLPHLGLNVRRTKPHPLALAGSRNRKQGPLSPRGVYYISSISIEPRRA
jgi:hypothetical protein